MRVFFDNCTSPVLATTLHGFVQHHGHEATHIKDLPCGRHAPDVVWMAYLAETGADWLVVTGDLRISRNKAERVAFRQAGLKGCILAPAFQGFPMHQQASFLLWRWPDVVLASKNFAAPFLFELPANRTAKLRQIPL